MIFETPILQRITDAVAQTDAEGSARNSAALALARFASHTGMPSIGMRGSVRLYVWRTKRGNFALYYDGQPHVVELFQHTQGAPIGDVFVPAVGATNPALSSLPHPSPAHTSVESPMARRNPGPSFESLERAVKGAASESAQVNVIVRALAGMGMGGAENPEVHTTSVDRATYRVYIWRDTPFHDAVVLGTGPSFNPEVRLGAQIPSVPGVGIYIRAKLDSKKPRTLAGAGRAASRVRAADDRSTSTARERDMRAVARHTAAIAAREEEQRREAARSRMSIRAPSPSSFSRPAPSRRTVSGGEYVSLASEREAREPKRASASSEKQELVSGLGNLLDKLKAMKR
jgi:hypothetical protein